jgi:hypothetical protein
MLEPDPYRYAVNLSALETEKVQEYIVSQEQLCIAAMTHLQIAWDELRQRGAHE